MSIHYVHTSNCCKRYTLIVSALTERAMYVAKYTSIFSFVGRIWFGSMCSL